MGWCRLQRVVDSFDGLEAWLEEWRGAHGFDSNRCPVEGVTSGVFAMFEKTEAGGVEGFSSTPAYSSDSSDEDDDSSASVEAVDETERRLDSLLSRRASCKSTER